MEALQPWLGLELSMRFKGTGRTRAFIGTLPGDMDLETILTGLAQQNPELPLLHVQVVSSSQNQTCVFVLCHKDGAAQVEEALRSIGFAQPSNPTKHSPAQRKQELDERIAEAQDEIDQAEKKILALADQRAVSNLRLIISPCVRRNMRSSANLSSPNGHLSSPDTFWPKSRCFESRIGKTI